MSNLTKDHHLTRVKHLAHEVRRTNGGYTAHTNFYNSLNPELLLALIECAEALRELYGKKVTTLTPEDHDFMRSWIAISRLEAECLPII